MRTATLLADNASPFLARMVAHVRKEKTATPAPALQVIQAKTAAPPSHAVLTTPATMEPPAMSVETAMCAPVYLATVATTANFFCLSFPGVSQWWMDQTADIQKV